MKMSDSATRFHESYQPPHVRLIGLDQPPEATLACRYCEDDAVHYCTSCTAPLCEDHRLFGGECGRCQHERRERIPRKTPAKLGPSPYKRIPVRVDWADGTHNTIELRRASAEDLVRAIREAIEKKGERSGFRWAGMADDMAIVTMGDPATTRATEEKSTHGPTGRPVAPIILKPLDQDEKPCPGRIDITTEARCPL
jgi:hypothetical protein